MGLVQTIELNYRVRRYSLLLYIGNDSPNYLKVCIKCGHIVQFLFPLIHKSR